MSEQQEREELIKKIGTEEVDEEGTRTRYYAAGVQGQGYVKNEGEHLWAIAVFVTIEIDGNRSGKVMMGPDHIISMSPPHCFHCDEPYDTANELPCVGENRG